MKSNSKILFFIFKNNYKLNVCGCLYIYIRHVAADEDNIVFREPAQKVQIFYRPCCSNENDNDDDIKLFDD